MYEPSTYRIHDPLGNIRLGEQLDEVHCGQGLMLQLKENQGKIQSGNMMASFPILQLLFRMEKHPSYFPPYQTLTEKTADGVRESAKYMVF